MDAHLTATRARPRPHEELLAVVDGDRLLLASGALLELVGYSRSEATSPEFRAAYLFHPDSPRAALSAHAGPGPFEVLLSRPGRGAESYRAHVLALDLPDSISARAILFSRRDEPEDPSVAERTMRAVVASLRSITAEQMHRLRKIDDELDAAGAAHPEELRHRLPALLRARTGFYGVDESLQVVERSVRRQAALRRPYHRE